MQRSERYFGRVPRLFALGQDVDESAVTAKYVIGLLELHLPKHAAAKTKQILIQ